MKFIKKWISVFFACILTLGSITACSNNIGNNGNNSGTQTVSYNENHYANITQRNDYIVKEGKAFYTIVIPSDAKYYEKEAADLLNEYYEKALGVKLDVITDDKATDDGQYISIGKTQLLKESGIAIPYSRYGNDGFRIVTKNDNVYISGSDSVLRRGTYYGVQEFLYHTIGYRGYTLTEIRYEEKDSAKMADFDVVEIPDFDKRRVGYVTTSGVTATRAGKDHNMLLRLASRNEDAIPVSGHSHFEILPPATYYNAHPEWYWWTTAGDYTPSNHQQFYWDAQLCLTNEEMTKEFVRVVTQLFLDNPEATFGHLGQADNDHFCACENCDNWKMEHNTNSTGLLVHFTNKVTRAVTKNLQERDPARTITIEMFAYEATIEPPVNLVNGEYVADCEEVIPDENVMIQFTPLSGYNGTQTIDHHSNQQYYQYLQGWKAITDNISTWFYCIDFDTFQINVKNWDIVARDLRTLKDSGIREMYYQGPLHEEVFQMYEMRLWVLSKLMWNTSLQWKPLAEEFIREFYGPVSGQIQDYYDYMTTYYEKLRTVDNLTGGLFNATVLEDKKNWSYSYVEGARNIFVDGYDVLEELKISNPANFEKYYWRLTGVYFENMYMQLDFYMEKYSVEHRLETLALFKDAMAKFNVKKYDQTNSWNKYLDKWEASIYVE